MCTVEALKGVLLGATLSFRMRLDETVPGEFRVGLDGGKDRGFELEVAVSEQDDHCCKDTQNKKSSDNRSRHNWHARDAGEHGRGHLVSNPVGTDRLSLI